MNPIIFPQDKANHYIYGTLAATLAGVLVMVFCALLLGLKAGLPLVGAIAAVLTPLFVGVWKERQDAKANARAAYAGQAPVHEVSHRDRNATALGAVPVAVPLLLMQLIEVLLRP